jgi:hypothetical protein
MFNVTITINAQINNTKGGGGQTKDSSKPRSQLMTNGVQTSKIQTDEEKANFHDERRRQEHLKKKYLRAPKSRNFVIPRS